jgi:hypothetical protein
MTARCEQDLSPGALTDPAIRLTGLEIARIGFKSAFSGLWTASQNLLDSVKHGRFTGSHRHGKRPTQAWGNDLG